MPEVLLHRWNNWEGGVGHPIEEGRNGMHTANKILGLRGELRPAPVATDVTVATDPGHHYQYFFEEAVTAGQTPTLDASSSKTDTDSTSGDAKTISWTSHTTAANDSRILLVYTGQFDGSGSTPSSVTYGGVALTYLAARTIGGSFGVITIWYLVDPAAGTGTIEINWAVTRGVQLGIAETWYKVDQTGPFGSSVSGAAANDAGPATATAVSASGEIVVNVGACGDAVQTMTVVNETQVKNITAGDARMATSYEAGAASVAMDWTLGAAADWGVLAVPLLGASPGPGYLYAQRGKKAGSSSTVKVNKVSLAYTDFANLETGQHDLTPLTVPGQSVRHQGFWWFPMGDNQSANKLSVIGSGAIANDTLDGSRANEWGADHLANLGNQMIGAHAHSGNDAGGLRILKVDGDPEEEDDWGSAFQVGDKSERAAGLAGLAGLSFVLNVEGLYSFNKSARTRLVFEDFKAWRHAFDNIPIVPWKGGLALSHPTGLLFWEPGRLPVNIGLNADIGRSVLSPSGPTALRGGRYHGLAPAGDFLYTIYQPDITSTTANVMVGYPRENSPYDLVWQQLGTTTLQDTDHMLGCFVSVSSKPLSTEYVTPTLWYGNDDDLSYVVLGTTASPFRTRADTHVVEAAGDAYMSELLFESPTEITKAVVYAQNMASGDEWQLKVLADGEGETNLGPPIKSNGRHEITVDRHDVYRLMLHVNWTTSDTTARAAPSIQRIEFYGYP
jgi:hypothetical protein